MSTCYLFQLFDANIRRVLGDGEKTSYFECDPTFVSGGLDDLQNGVDGDVTTMCFLRWIGWQDHRWDVGVKEK